MNKKTLGILRIEEWFYIAYFGVLLAISLLEGEFLITLYLDRFTWSFVLVIGILAGWRFHLTLWRMNRPTWGPIRDEISSGLWVLRDLFNLFMCISMYRSLAKILNIFPLRDQWLIEADQWLFGTHVALLLEPLISPTLTKILVFCYLTLFAYLPILTLAFIGQGNRRAMREFMASLGIALFFGYLGYIIVPAIGPSFTLQEQFSRNIWSNDYMKLTKEALGAAIDANRLARDCFPSMHTCLAILPLIFAWRYTRILFFLFLPFVCGLIFATLYLRFHYFVDLIAGAILAVLACRAGPWLLSKWQEYTGKPIEDM